ncbi:MAG: DUF5615 family PIN-like protein [Thermomicrobiales bacterium]|nr:DUF5615 family PIN-like protein [Thermomicrobiales bacterium]
MTRRLLDAILPPKLARAIGRLHGVDAESLIAVGRERLRDEQVIEYARRVDRVIVTLDRDFATLFARTSRPLVSIVYIRVSNEHRRTPALLEILTRYVTNHLDTLEGGPVFVTVTPETVIAVRNNSPRDVSS